MAARNQKVNGQVWVSGKGIPKQVTVTHTTDLGYEEHGYVKDGKVRQPVKKGIYGTYWLPDNSK
jgi:hypothetical protein